MAENKEYAVQKQENGTIQISEEVIATVASVAAKDVDGVSDLSGNFGDDLAGMLGMKNTGKGIRVQIEDDGVRIECSVVAKYGCSVVAMAKELQSAILSAVESMTGLKVKNVAVNISGIAVNPAK